MVPKKSFLLAMVSIVVIILWYSWYRRTNDMIVDTFTQRSEDAITQMENVIELMFNESKFNETSFESKLRLVLDRVITFSEESKKHLLKLLNTKRKSISKSPMKTSVERIYNKLIDEYMEQSIDISCIINTSNCDTNTNMQGTCGTLMNKMKSAMNKESELRKYKEFVEDLKGMMDEL